MPSKSVIKQERKAIYKTEKRVVLSLIINPKLYVLFV